MPTTPGNILLEIIPVVSNHEGIFILLPTERRGEGLPDTFWLEPWQSPQHPHDTVKCCLNQRLQIEPIILHSTSWRAVQIGQQSVVLLTYLAVMPTWLRTRPGVMALPFDHAQGQITRGGSTTPPLQIQAWQVARHAFEHLHYLSRTDEAVQFKLSSSWKQHLKSFTFSLFRAE